MSADVDLEKHPTTNIEHPTSNELRRLIAKLFLLKVGCWMFDVSRAHGKEKTGLVSQGMAEEAGEFE